MISTKGIRTVAIHRIVVAERRRQPKAEEIEVMRESLRRHGLLTPISIQLVYDKDLLGDTSKPIPVLVCGATRLAAAKALGWTEISTQILDGSDIEFREAEIVENVHRSHMDELERSAWITNLIRLYEAEPPPILEQAGQVAPPVAKHGRRQLGSGLRKAARAIKKADETEEAARSRIRRATKIDSIVQSAKDAAAAAGLADRQGDLLDIANRPSAEEQVARVAEIAAERSSATQRQRQSTPPPSSDHQAERVLKAWRCANTDAKRKIYDTLRAEFLQLEQDRDYRTCQSQAEVRIDAAAA